MDIITNDDEPSRALLALEDRVRASLCGLPSKRLHPHYLAQDVHLQLEKVLACAQTLLDLSSCAADAVLRTATRHPHPLVAGCPEAMAHAVHHFHSHFAVVWKPLIDEGAVYLVNRTHNGVFYPRKWHDARETHALLFLLHEWREEVGENLHILAWAREQFGTQAPFLETWWTDALASIRCLENWTVIVSAAGEAEDGATMSLLQHPLLPHPAFFVTIRWFVNQEPEIVFAPAGVDTLYRATPHERGSMTMAQ